MRERTHWDKCYLSHHDCATIKIAELQDEVERLREAIQDLHDHASDGGYVFFQSAHVLEGEQTLGALVVQAQEPNKGYEGNRENAKKIPKR